MYKKICRYSIEKLGERGLGGVFESQYAIMVK